MHKISGFEIYLDDKAKNQGQDRQNQTFPMWMKDNFLADLHSSRCKGHLRQF